MNDENVFLIYQLKQVGDTRDFHFESFDSIQSKGLSVDKENYNHIYTAPLTDDITPDSIYVQFNLDHPADFAGHSLSVSDIIVFRRDGEATAYYVEPVGFVELPGFLGEPYKYYSTQRPIDIGTFPKTENGPVTINNFDKREWVENASCRAWGYLTYTEPLTQKQMGEYELRAASDNPGHARISPYQLEAQVQVVGKWEQSRRMPELARLTWWNNDFGDFAKKDYVTNERLTERFTKAVEDKICAAARKAYKKFNPDLLKGGAEQVQVVGTWEDWKGLPDNERYTWHSPSKQGFALREPVVNPEKLMQRYYIAQKELRQDIEKQLAPKTIAEQLTEGAEQAAKHNSDLPDTPEHPEI